jgi:hypothetical protein
METNRKSEGERAIEANRKPTVNRGVSLETE